MRAAATAAAAAVSSMLAAEAWPCLAIVGPVTVQLSRAMGQPGALPVSLAPPPPSVLMPLVAELLRPKDAPCCMATEPPGPSLMPIAFRRDLPRPGVGRKKGDVPGI